MNKIYRNEKGFSAVEGLVILIILVLIGGAGYLVYRHDHKKTTPVATVATSSTTAKKATISNTASTKSTAQTVNPYAGWLSYTNKVAGYTIQYPSTWSIKGFSSGGGGAIPASQFNGEEVSILLYYPNSKVNSLGIWINNNTKYETDADGEGDGISVGTATYSDGSIIKTLSNGMNMWGITSNSTSTSYGDADIEAVTNGEFGYKIDSGAILQVSMGFQYAAGQSTNLSYSQQMNSSELQTAYSILESIK